MNKETEIRLVGKLLKMTIDGSLTWAIGDLPDVVGFENEIYSEKYAASTGGLKFQLYQCKRRWQGYGELTLGEPIQVPNHARTYWETRTILDVIDDDKMHSVHSIVDVEDMRSVRSLYDAVRRSVTKVDEKIKHFIDDDTVSRLAE